MEKFILIFRGGYIDMAAAHSKAELDVIKTWNDWMQGLVEKGILAGGDSIHKSGKQVKGKAKVISEGPYAEGNELIAGYLIINAKDINHAVEISKGCPVLIDDGSVEVRPIQKR